MTSGTPLKVVVVDDELPAREGLSALLEADDRLAVVAQCASAREAREAISTHRPDVVFLDIEMPGGDGFSVLEDMGVEALPGVVFVTAFDSYALRAFEVDAVDYLLKPFSDDRLARTLTRVVERSRRPTLEALHSAFQAFRSERAGIPMFDRRLVVRHRGRTEYVEVEDIVWMKADGDYIEVHMTDRSSRLVRGPLSRLVGRLDPEHFLRTHRSYAVRIAGVKALRMRSGGTAVLDVGQGIEVPVSARRRVRVDQALAGRSD